MFLLGVLVSCAAPAFSLIDRHSIVSRYNPSRNASSLTTPMQVGNGNFAFGADVTGLQTFQPFAIMSTWGWKNDSLPVNKTMQDVLDYRGVEWSNHDRLVQYEFGGEATVQQWLISNPNRVNLGSIGFVFRDDSGKTIRNITEKDLQETHQTLDLWTGTLTSQFFWEGHQVMVNTTSAQDTDSVGIIIQSTLLQQGRLAIFFDFPWNDGTLKFSDPFVGVWNAASMHTTSLRTFPSRVEAQIEHTMVTAQFLTSIGGDPFSITRDSATSHRYTLIPLNTQSQSTFSLTATYTTLDSPPASVPNARAVAESSAKTWVSYWSNSGFVDVLTGSTDSRADELQRRIILSRYLMRVNEASDNPPQESGLVNNGWYGKFHMEMYFWHCMHWALWNNWDLLNRSNTIYSRFLPTALDRAIQEHWDSGARWSKMTDPSGRSAPGEINELLIWQQVHPLVFAQYEYRAFSTRKTLEKWGEVVKETANWMADFAWFNESSGFYDLGPPMYVVSEDTSPNVTRNPAFELAYWRFGFDIAESWMEKLGEEVPQNWSTVKANLAKLPIDNGTYSVYEGIESDFWTDPAYTNDHPALVGLFGWLPQTEDVDLGIAKLTMEKVWTHWNISNCWGWDFPMLAMSAARNGDADSAVEWLLHDLFKFDDVGMPIGGVRVPTPYFPGSGGLLLAVAMMARGWDGSNGTAPGFPEIGWNVRAEGLSVAL